MTTPYERNLRLSREAKRRRTGTCSDCGAVTRYGGRKGEPVSERCFKCAAVLAGKTKRGKGSVNRRVLLYLRKPRRYSEIRDHFGLSDGMANLTLQRLLRYGLVERVERGVYRRVEK
jgi:hypothetical protein